MPKDPYRWTVDAETPEAFNRWNNRRLKKMPEDVARLYTASVNTLIATTEGTATRNVKERSNPFCLKVDGRTVRDVIIEGYVARIDAYNRQIILATDVLTKNITNAEADGLDDQTRARFTSAVAVQRERLANWEESLAKEQQTLEKFKADHP